MNDLLLTVEAGWPGEAPGQDAVTGTVSAVLRSLLPRRPHANVIPVDLDVSDARPAGDGAVFDVLLT